MKYYLYVLRSSKDEKLYIGVSADPVRRLREHNSGKSKSTRYRRPFEMIYTKEFEKRKEAYKYEWWVKNTGEGNKSLKESLPG